MTRLARAAYYLNKGAIAFSYFWIFGLSVVALYPANGKIDVARGGTVMLLILPVILFLLILYQTRGRAWVTFAFSVVYWATMLTSVGYYSYGSFHLQEAPEPIQLESLIWLTSIIYVGQFIVAVLTAVAALLIKSPAPPAPMSREVH
jgi:hypothetical protein